MCVLKLASRAERTRRRQVGRYRCKLLALDGGGCEEIIDSSYVYCRAARRKSSAAAANTRHLYRGLSTRCRPLASLHALLPAYTASRRARHRRHPYVFGNNTTSKFRTTPKFLN